MFLFSNFCFAQDYSDPVAEGEIVVEKRTDLTESYRERRNRFGVLFSVNYEKFYPKEYLSLIQNQTFDKMSGGDSIPVVGAELGLKFNFTLGSLSGILGYGGGTLKNESAKVDKISAKITKATLNFALDTLMSEPWVVPYGQIGASQIDWLEESRDSGNISKEESFKTDWNLNYKVGLLLQLNWLENSIDPNTHTNGLTSSGLQNTFLDVFYASYASPSEVATVAGQTGDADLQSNNFGVGLKLEF
jgi:hypothetical protein